MSREPPLSVIENGFILKAVDDGWRLDLRGLNEYRPVNISFGEEYGNVQVVLGKTKSVALFLSLDLCGAD